MSTDRDLRKVLNRLSFQAPRLVELREMFEQVHGQVGTAPEVADDVQQCITVARELEMQWQALLDNLRARVQEGE